MATQAALPEIPLVSVVMPAFNAATTLEEAIKSVLDQDHQHIELIVVDDGSTDKTAEVVSSFNDPRIQFYHQPNAGVSAARNAGLQKMSGDVLAFCDADDRLTKSSISARLAVLKARPEVDFVDGAMRSFGDQGEGETRIPTYRGDPKPALLNINPDCFMGITWLIRVHANVKYQFKPGLTHGEDLLFLLSICKGGHYAAIPEVCYEYRIGQSSAMSDITGIASGYKSVYEAIKSSGDFSEGEAAIFKRRIKGIMAKTHFKKLQLVKGLSWLLY